MDILRRAEGDRFDLIEVKSSTSVKDVHIPDVAIQTHVVEGYGIPIRRAYLMRVDNSYIYEGGDHDLEGLFALDDVTDLTRSFMDIEMHDHMERIRESLGTTDTLAIETGRHCQTPYVCPFFVHCHEDEPEHPIRNLPRLGQALEQRLKEDGITAIGDIPPEFSGMSATQQRVRDSIAAGLPYVGPGLKSRLAEIEFPAAFLDFEAFSPVPTSQPSLLIVAQKPGLAHSSHPVGHHFTQTVHVVHQRVCHEHQLGILTFTLPHQSRLWIGHALASLVAQLLPTKVLGLRGSIAGVVSIIVVVTSSEALDGCCRLYQRTVHAEVLV